MPISKHEQSKTGKSEWLTPPNIIKSLGSFDLDPCAPVNRPWDTATLHYDIFDNGLIKPWNGRIWLNPPYGDKTAKWLQRMAEHNNGIALTFARTETQMFFESIWYRASALLFLKSRITFYNVDGKPGKWTGGGPSVLIAYNEANANALSNSGIPGAFIKDFQPINIIEKNTNQIRMETL